MQKEINKLVDELFNDDILNDIDNLENKVRENEIEEYKKNIKELKVLYPTIVKVLREVDIFDVGEDYYREGIKLDYSIGDKCPLTNYSILVYVNSSKDDHTIVFRNKANKDTYTVYINANVEDSSDYYTLQKISEMSVEFMNLFKKKLEKYLSHRRSYMDELRSKINEFERKKK